MESTGGVMREEKYIKHIFPDSVKEEKNLIESKYLLGFKKWCFMFIYFF